MKRTRKNTRTGNKTTGEKPEKFPDGEIKNHPEENQKKTTETTAPDTQGKQEKEKATKTT